MRSDIMEFAAAHLAENDLPRLRPALERLAAMLGAAERFLWLTDGLLDGEGILAICERGIVFFPNVPTLRERWFPWPSVQYARPRPGTNGWWAIDICDGSSSVLIDQVGDQAWAEEFAEVILAACRVGYAGAAVLAETLEDVGGNLYSQCLRCNRTFTGRTTPCPRCRGATMPLLALDNDVEVVILFECQYLGGHPMCPVPIKQVVVSISGLGVNAVSRHGDLFECDWYTIQALDADGPGDVRTRVTFTRVAALGLFALAVPKTETVSYLIVGTRDGELIFEAKDVSVWELRASISPYLSMVHAETAELEQEPGAEETPSARRPEDRLRQLAGLYHEGLISSEEYSEQKAEILRSV